VQFYEGLDVEEGARVGRLFGAIEALVEGRREDAGRDAESIVRDMPDDEDGSGALAVRTFAETVLARARHDLGRGGNLYLDARPPGAQLRAFELLRLRTPLIPFAYAAGNRALLQTLDSPTDLTLVDVGIGRGQQVRALLRNPSARRLLSSIHVVGIEPDSSADTGAGALEVAAENVLEAAEEARVPATFHAIPKRAEELRAADLSAAGLRGHVAANAAFALHHVEEIDDAGTRRVRVLETLREAGVMSVVLVEPDSNHYVGDLLVRFAFAYRHYGTLASALHSMLTPSDAELVWREFFAKEVQNVIVHEGPQRTERHEEASRWADHLSQAGWSPEVLADVLPQSAAPPGFDVRCRPSAFSLSFRSVPLLSVLRAQPA